MLDERINYAIEIARIIARAGKPCDCLCVSECIKKPNYKYQKRADDVTCDSLHKAELIVDAGWEKKAEETESFFDMIAYSLPDYSEGPIWSTGDEILVKTEEAADALATLIELVYRSKDREVIVNTGYYDPVEDERNGEVDRCTGWWYVNIG